MPAVNCFGPANDLLAVCSACLRRPAAMGGFGGFTDGGFNGGRDVGLPDMPAGVDVEVRLLRRRT